jgi:hypothetical protein
MRAVHQPHTGDIRRKSDIDVRSGGARGQIERARTAYDTREA